MIKEVLEQNVDLQEFLFIRGFLITTNKNYDLNNFPFYGNWNCVDIKQYHILTHKRQKIYIYKQNDISIFLIGHCLNPFDSLYNENDILEKIYKNRNSCQEMLTYINQLTGSFLLGVIRDDKLDFLSDPSGMLFSCYGKIDGEIYISSHAQLVGDLCELEKGEYISRLEKYKYFYKYGLFFPGDLTQYDGLKRVLQNHIMSFNGEEFSCQRFYPCATLKLVDTQAEYEQLIEKVAKIMKDTIALAIKKWDNLALSMTGGMDSKTTLACANGMYNQLQFYSYISMEGDKIDAEAAHKIADEIGVQHDIYEIADNDEAFEKIDAFRAVIEHNNGGYKVNKNDVRKRYYFVREKLFDVEIKSWISEIARANYYKKFGLKKLPKHLSPRHMTSMYKIFTTQRRLAKETDAVFAAFIDKTIFNKLPMGYDESDMYLWEFRYSAWGGMVITSEHSFSNEIFIPYNNRLLLDCMLSAPLQKRISDEFHEDIIKYANKKIDDCGINITNWNETKKRMYLEKIYFKVHSFFKGL